jgi:hypothetical protein
MSKNKSIAINFDFGSVLLKEDSSIYVTSYDENWSANISEDGAYSIREKRHPVQSSKAVHDHYSNLANWHAAQSALWNHRAGLARDKVQKIIDAMRDEK